MASRRPRTPPCGPQRTAECGCVRGTREPQSAGRAPILNFGSLTMRLGCSIRKRGATTLWRSADGLTWDLVALPDPMAAVAANDAAFHDGIIVAVGSDKFARGDVLWVSFDGAASWEPI